MPGSELLKIATKDSKPGKITLVNNIEPNPKPKIQLTRTN